LREDYSAEELGVPVAAEPKVRFSKARQLSSVKLLGNTESQHLMLGPPGDGHAGELERIANSCI